MTALLLGLGVIEVTWDEHVRPDTMSLSLSPSFLRVILLSLPKVKSSLRPFPCKEEFLSLSEEYANGICT